MGIENIPRTIWWGTDETDGADAVFMIDQTRLPLQGDLLVARTAEAVARAIKSLAVRGAPAIGVAAALGLAVWTSNESKDETVESYLESLREQAELMAAARPTAVNLGWGARRIVAFATARADLGLEALKEAVIDEAAMMQGEDEERNRAIGAHGAALLPEGSNVLTHCNAGSLATVYYGTALGVIFTAHEQGRINHVWVDETRPVNQGGRLTAWELLRADVPSTLITDNMAASVMRSGWVDAVIVGADRICANGDVANKIGTYGLAILAKEHGIPFYVAAPSSTVDLTLASGELIPIEERDPREVEGVTISGTISPRSGAAQRAFDMLTDGGTYEFDMGKGHQMLLSRKGGAYAFDAWFKTTPPGVAVYNPAFDVTPAAYVTAIITENGVATRDEGYEARLAELVSGTGSLHEIDEA